MKTKILLGLFLGFGFASNAQDGSVGIGTTKPDNSAILDMHSSNKGFLIPRMTLSNRNLIEKPAVGLKVYQTDGISGEYSFDGQKWNRILSENDINSVSSVAVANPDNWSITGNAGLTAGTHFIGGDIPLEFKQNGARVGLLSTGDNMFMGYLAGNTNAGNLNVGMGYQALKVNTSGSNNTAFGSNALAANVSGGSNVALGSSSLIANVGGSFNIGIGYQALNVATAASSNVGIGYAALQQATGSNNVAIGYAALNASGVLSGNVAIGYLAGLATTGNNGIFLGNQAGSAETTGGKLYIANSGTTTPLIYGDFAAKYVTIGDVSPDLRNQGVATGGYNLLVKGGILTEKVKVAVAAAGTDWADYVFEPSYKLMSLEKVEQFTKENKHLPNVPSADQLAKDGLDLGQTSKMFMEKIEELTLYIIELNKEVKLLKEENQKLKK